MDGKCVICEVIFKPGDVKYRVPSFNMRDEPFMKEVCRSCAKIISIAYEHSLVWVHAESEGR